MSEECTCDMCVAIRRWRSVLQIDTVEKEKTFEEIIGLLEMAETDNVYVKSILDGSWPNARPILERALEKVKNSAPSV